MYRALSLVLVFFLSVAGFAKADGFLSSIADLPLMPGLSELADKGVVFDKPAGRIVEAYAEGAVSKAAVEDFYRQTLPQLGWQPGGGTAYQREGEQLDVEVLSDSGSTLVRFTLRPQ